MSVHRPSPTTQPPTNVYKKLHYLIPPQNKKGDLVDTIKPKDKATYVGFSAYLPLHDAVRDAHLAAESRQPDDELDGVDVVGDDDEGCLLLLDQGGHVLKTKLDHLSTTNHDTI